VTLASFDGAIDPAPPASRDFPAWVEPRSPRAWWRRASPAGGPVLTGPASVVRRPRPISSQCRGFEGVHQFKGGILPISEEVPERQSRWRGECFRLLTSRVALITGSEPGATAFCHAAAALFVFWPIASSPANVEGVSLPPPTPASANSSNADWCSLAQRQRQISWRAGRGRTHRFCSLGGGSPSQSSSVKLALLPIRLR